MGGLEIGFTKYLGQIVLCFSQDKTFALMRRALGFIKAALRTTLHSPLS